MSTTTVRMGAAVGRRHGLTARHDEAAPLERIARALQAAWRGAVIDPLHAALDRHERGAGLEPLNAATLRDLGRY